MQTIRIALDWAVNTNHTGLIVAHQRGLFRDAGIDVQVLPVERDRFVTDVVLAGDADFGYAFEGTVIERRTTGDPLISVAAVAQHHWSSVAVLQSRGITRPAQLAHLRYASFGHQTMEQIMLEQMMRSDGVTASDFIVTPVRFASIDTLVRGEADFLWIYDGIEGVEAGVHGVALTTFAPSDFGVPDYYAPTIFAHERLLKDESAREAGSHFMQALAKGYQLAAIDPDSALADIQALGNSWGDWLFTDEASTRASQRYQSERYLDASGNWGYQGASMWTDFPHFLWQRGAFGEIAELDYQQLYTNELLG